MEPAWHLWPFLGWGGKGGLTALPCSQCTLRGAEGVQLQLWFPRRWSNPQEAQVSTQDLLFIGLLNFPVPLHINHRPSKMCRNLLLLLCLACKVWSSEATKGLSTDKCLSGAASSASGLKSQLKNCFHDLMQMSNEYRYADGLILNLLRHKQGTSTYHAMQLSSLSQKPELVIWSA